jgi:hypothetical protein
MLKRYESYAAFVAEAKSNKTARKNYSRESSSWYGGIDYATAVALAESGDESFVSRAQDLMDQLDAVSEGAPVRTWTPSPFGAYPVVPEYLAGHPECMRNLSASGEQSPVALYVATTCSAALSAEQMLARGTAILALVLKLQQIRPVELYLLAETHGRTDGDYLQIIPVDSKPISLAHACFGICHVGFARHLTYALAYAHDGFNGQWPNSRGDGETPKSAYVAKLREIMGMGPDDLYIKSIHALDPMPSNPVAWVNEQLARYATVDAVA